MPTSVRSNPPKIFTIDDLVLPPPKVVRLKNGIPVYVVSSGDLDVLKLEIVFRAGRPFEDKQLAGIATSSLLQEGTKNYDSATIAELFDYYGATLTRSVQLDTSNIVVYTIGRHFKHLMPVISELLSAPVFPEKELKTYINRNLQRLKVNLAKADVVAYRELTKSIFGADHPYGYNSTAKAYKALKREDIVDHFERHYHAGNCVVFLSGKVDDEVIELLDLHLSPVLATSSFEEPTLPPVPESGGTLQIAKKGGAQSAIRYGVHLFPRRHRDYAGFSVLNMILGGYFGSRLMRNIREEKGYTYSIFSSIEMMNYDGCFEINTEVGNEFALATEREIEFELERLRQDLVAPEELDMVRNYMLGTMLNQLDGPFHVAETIKSAILEEASRTDWELMLGTIRSITPQQIRELAQTYLAPENIWKVRVGKPL